MTSNAPMTSNASTYSPNTTCAIATGFDASFAASSPWAGPYVARCSTTPASTMPRPTPASTPIQRWPRIVSTSESDVDADEQ